MRRVVIAVIAAAVAGLAGPSCGSEEDILPDARPLADAHPTPDGSGSFFPDAVIPDADVVPPDDGAGVPDAAIPPGDGFFPPPDGGVVIPDGAPPLDGGVIILDAFTDDAIISMPL